MTYDDPWLLAGDFNEIIAANEKRRGAHADVGRCSAFASMLDDYQLMDLGGSGPFFTWKGPKFSHLDRVYKRLDREVANAHWRTMFDEATIHIGPRVYSDHNPLYISLCKDNNNWEDRPFHLFPPWLDHSQFLNVLTENWRKDTDVGTNLTELVPALKEWNTNVFGFIPTKKAVILRRLAGIQSSLDYGHNSYLDKMECELRSELDKTLELEEKLLYHKSRAIWIREGDRNTKFYHTTAVARRRKSKILALKNAAGIWIRSELNLKNMVVNYYKQLFVEEEANRKWMTTSINWPPLVTHDK
ncbi:uncharacterized protein LOC133316492 [Gastrolobium bilobum]|uniref:uncharacterized protein LOC133316492 n=1 Tax=Gastrolobium bilobum TaxID=150636 RepID=UPI002AB0A406|nr:uncharacterized protein LOC133316492 [Gastrolobium bilobum]